MAKTDPVEMNIDGVRQLVGARTNKVEMGASSDVEGADGDREDAFALGMTDAELLELHDQWESKYVGYESRIKKRQDANLQYYLGRQNQGSSDSTDGISTDSNLLFEAEETFLPAALSKNPEPVVWSDNTKEGVKLSSDVKVMLQYHADVLVLRRKLTRMTRHWSIYFLGAVKHGWDKKINDITTDIVNPQNLILDPEAAIDCYGDYDGSYLGERKHCSADKLAEMFPSFKEYITVMVDGKMGTDCTYTEWSTATYSFFTFKDRILDKYKNPHFNYDKDEDETDEDGVEQNVTHKGNNHFAQPKIPYTFLAVFSLGKQPHDETGLLEQNIPNQNRITRRTKQIDVNLSLGNNSIAVSGDNFNQETGKQAAIALQKGHPVLVPKGRPISEAIMRINAPDFPAAAFRELETSKQDLRSIFGTEGISSQPPNEDTTARGMILNQQFDNTRIGGGIGDALEQVADNIFNWWVQLYHVYYDEDHFAAILGQMKAVEYVTLSALALDRKIVVSVAPDSMKPHDEITEINQAIEFFDKGVIGPKTLLTIASFPDPDASAADGALWQVDKMAYIRLNFPDLAQKLAGLQQEASANAASMAAGGGAPPVESPAPPASLSADPASAALENVPLPK